MAGDLVSNDDLAYLDSLRAVSSSLDVHILVNPTPSQIRELLSRAKVYVSAVAMVATLVEDAWRYLCSGAEMISAIAARCVPVVAAQGAAAQMLDTFSLAFTFQGINELPLALGKAIEQAEALKLQVCRSESSADRLHREAWAALLDSLDGNALPSNIFTPALVVVGMHRFWDVWLWPGCCPSWARTPEQLMPPAPDNPNGFWGLWTSPNSMIAYLSTLDSAGMMFSLSPSTVLTHCRRTSKKKVADG